MVRSANSGAAVAGARISGHEAPGSLAITDLFRPQWSYPEIPSAQTDQAGHARLKVPMETPRGIEALDANGRRIPKRQRASTQVLVEKSGFKKQSLSKTLAEWDKVSSPVVIKLERE